MTRAAPARRAATLLALTLLLTGLGGCGGDQRSAYCEAVKENQTELSEVLGEGGPVALLEALPIFRDLRDAAPSDIRDEWDTVVASLESLQDALDDADVDPATYDRDHPPPGLSKAERDRIDAAARELNSATTRAAFAGVEQQARDVCQTPLRV